MVDRRLTVFFFFSLLAFVLTGCPRFAYVEVYNNTTTVLMIDSSGLEKDVKPGQTARFRFTGNSFKVKSNIGTWGYSRNIPHSGRDGPYFDGTLRIQINADGVIYALKIGESPPLSDSSEQPHGYPLYPNQER